MIKNIICYAVIIGTSFVIGYVAGRRKREKCNDAIVPSNISDDDKAPTPAQLSAAVQAPPQVQEAPSKPWMPAKVAVRNHLSEITPLLHGVSDKGIVNISEWDNAIAKIDNKNLTEMWENSKNNSRLWLSRLSSFGLRRDMLGEFTAQSVYLDMYCLMGNGQIIVGEKYKVISPCWLYTDSDNNKVVALKGIVQNMM